MSKENRGPMERAVNPSRGVVSEANTIVILEATVSIPDGPVDQVSAKIRKHLKRISEMTGGYTLMSTVGGWLDPGGDYIEEQGLRLQVCIFRSPDDRGAASVEDAVMQIIRTVGIALNQQEVMVVRTVARGACLPTSPAGEFRLV